MFLEIFIYLVIALGTLVLCITMFEKEECIEEKYVLAKSKDVKVRIIVETEGLDEEEIKRIGCIIERGLYQDIGDIVNEFTINNIKIF